MSATFCMKSSASINFPNVFVISWRSITKLEVAITAQTELWKSFRSLGYSSCSLRTNLTRECISDCTIYCDSALRLSVLFANTSIIRRKNVIERHTDSISWVSSMCSYKIVVRIAFRSWTEACGGIGGVNKLWDNTRPERRENQVAGSSSSSISLAIWGITIREISSLYCDKIWPPILACTVFSFA
jgi:hypothetical protein